MAIILVTYDLIAPGQKYTRVTEYMKRYDRCKSLESVWFLDTNATSEAIRDDLLKIIDNNDKLFVVRITRGWASFQLSCATWLNAPERTW